MILSIADIYDATFNEFVIGAFSSHRDELLFSYSSSRRSGSSTQRSFVISGFIDAIFRRHNVISRLASLDAALPAALEEVVRLRTTDLVGGGVMLRALVTLLFVFVYAYARSGPAVTVES